MNLTATTHTLELSTSTAATTHYVVSWVDIDKSGASTVTTPGSSHGTVSSATDTTIVSAPNSSVTRVVTSISVLAEAANTVTVQKDVSGTGYPAARAVLAAFESLKYEDSAGWDRVGADGSRLGRAKAADVTGRPSAFLKVGTSAEAAGVWYCHAKDSGMPGAWSPGAPGLAGRATDGTTAADAGCLPYRNAASGANYLTSYRVSSTTGHAHWLFDVLWVNTALVVTTLTAQTVNSVTFAARDLAGSSNGDGVWVGILVTTATTNVGAIASTIMTYTNQSGTGSRTATLASFPATAVAGTVAWFQLQAGDTGVRSIQSVTLSTSYGGGAISLIAAVPVAMAPAVVANVGSVGGAINPDLEPSGVRLYDGACLIPFYVASATTATNSAGFAEVTNR